MKKLNVFETIVYRVPSATFRYTAGDFYVYLDFVDRDATIKYHINTPRGRDTLERVMRKGEVKRTNIRNFKTTNPVQLSLF